MVVVAQSSVIRDAVADLWPRLKFIVLTDALWALGTGVEYRDVIRGIRIPENRPTFRCEEFAINLVSEVRKKEAGLYNYAIGMISLSTLNGEKQNHTMNLAMTSDSGLWLIEPQNYDFRRPDGKLDKPYFMWM